MENNSMPLYGLVDHTKIDEDVPNIDCGFGYRMIYSYVLNQDGTTFRVGMKMVYNISNIEKEIRHHNGTCIIKDDIK